MSSKNTVCKKKNKSVPSWMFLCDKMNNSKDTDIQIRKYAKDTGIDVAGKNRKTLCKEIAKSYDKKIKIESKGTETLKKEKLEVSKKKLVKLIDNAENGYSNYFTMEELDDWLFEKSSYDYHGILYYVRNFKTVKKNKKTQTELYNFKKFPDLREMLKLLIISIENIPISDRQKYVMFLKNLFTEEEKPLNEKDDIGEFYQYEYENEYDVLRIA
jgi:hypothetical protein